MCERGENEDAEEADNTFSTPAAFTRDDSVVQSVLGGMLRRRLRARGAGGVKQQTVMGTALHNGGDMRGEKGEPRVEGGGKCSIHRP
jgi:hypothetical protein